MSNWPTKKLGEVCDILDNLRKPITKRDREPGSVPYYGATGVQDYVVDFIFNEDLVLVGEDGARWGAGDKSAYKISGKSWVNNHAHVLRPYRDVILDDWLTYFLNVFDLSEYITGTTVKKLNQAKLRSIEISLPPIEVQKKIVAKLESVLAKVSEAKKLRAEARKSADNFLSAELHKIFEEGKEKGWEEKELGGLVIAVTPPKKIQKTDFQKEGDYPIIDQSQNEIAGWTNDICSLIKLEKPIVVFGDHTRVVKYIKEPFAQGADGIKILSTQEELLPKFLYVFLKNNPIESSGYRRHFSKLKKRKILLPPLTEQKKIVAHLDSISQRIQTIKELQNITENEFSVLERSILSKAFSGELI